MSEISANVEDIQTAIFLLISLAIFHAGFLTWKPKNIFSNNVSYIDIFNQFLYTFAHLEVCPDPSIWSVRVTTISILAYFLAIYNIFTFRSASWTLKTALVSEDILSQNKFQGHSSEKYIFNHNLGPGHEKSGFHWEYIFWRVWYTENISYVKLVG